MYTSARAQPQAPKAEKQGVAWRSPNILVFIPNCSSSRCACLRDNLPAHLALLSLGWHCRRPQHSPNTAKPQMVTTLPSYQCAVWATHLGFPIPTLKIQEQDQD